MHFTTVRLEGTEMVVPITIGMIMEALIVQALTEGLTVKVREGLALQNVSLLDHDKVIADFAFGYGTYSKAYLSMPEVEVMGLMTTPEAEKDTVVVLTLKEAIRRIHYYDGFLTMSEVHEYYASCIERKTQQAPVVAHPRRNKVKKRRTSPGCNAHGMSSGPGPYAADAQDRLLQPSIIEKTIENKKQQERH